MAIGRPIGEERLVSPSHAGHGVTFAKTAAQAVTHANNKANYDFFFVFVSAVVFSICHLIAYPSQVIWSTLARPIFSTLLSLVYCLGQ